MIPLRSPIRKPLFRAQGGCDVPMPPRERRCNDVNTFEITQTFANPDSYWSGVDPLKAQAKHGAIDIGNGHCGEPILAMAAGTVRNVQDNATAFGAPTNALGVLIDHGGGIESGYWHLGGYAVAHGARVDAGQVIGYLGRTGLGNVCHTHIELKVNGVKVDPEPYLFGTIPDTATGDDMDVVFQPSRVTLKVGARVRTAPSTTAGVAVGPLTLDQNRTVFAYGTVKGDMVVGSDDWGVYWDKANSRNLFYHSSTVESGQALPWPPAAAPAPQPVDCTAQVNEAKALGRLEGFNQAKAKATGLVGAMEP